MKQILAVVLVVMSSVALFARDSMIVSRHGLILDRNALRDVASIDPRIVHRVDPAIDPGIIADMSKWRAAGALTRPEIAPFMMQNVPVPDLHGARPLDRGTLDFKGGDSLRIAVPDLNMAVPKLFEPPADRPHVEPR